MRFDNEIERPLSRASSTGAVMGLNLDEEDAEE
jgi:hypothetical protein